MKKIFGLILMALMLPIVSAADYDVSVELTNKGNTKLYYITEGFERVSLWTDKKEEINNQYGNFIVGEKTKVDFNRGTLKLTGGTISELKIKVDSSVTTYYVIKDYVLNDNSLTIKNENGLKVYVKENDIEEEVEFNLCDYELDDTYICYTTKLELEKVTEVIENSDNVVIPIEKSNYYYYMIPFVALIAIGGFILIKSKGKRQ
ncbi:MAG: hypothetical protein PHU94_00065 [Bacilli bacterium]|nr:hypothetical protein [Bacilli bacterium]MDD4733902.1 hypothetical protein [Bacilli bacterium]